MAVISKAIDYAHPYSPLAIKHGFSDSGCWFVALYPDIDAHFGGLPLDETFTKDKAQAKQFASLRPEPFTNLHKKYFIE